MVVLCIGAAVEKSLSKIAEALNDYLTSKAKG